MFAVDRSTTAAMLFRLPPPMWGRDDHVGQVRERVRAVRLALEDIEPGSREVTGDDGLAERRLVDEPAAPAVHDPRAAAHPRQLSGPDQVMRLGRQRDVERDDVRGRQQLVELQPVRAEPLGLRDGPAGVVDDPRPERDEPLRDGLADPAHPDDPDRRVGEVVDAAADHLAGGEAAGPVDASLAGSRLTSASISMIACSAAPVRLTPGL
jgi:hypothetical protein